MVLAVGAVAAGFLGANAFVGDGREAFWGDCDRRAAGQRHRRGSAFHVPLWVKFLPLVVAVSGIALAYCHLHVAPGACPAPSSPGSVRSISSC